MLNRNMLGLAAGVSGLHATHLPTSCPRAPAESSMHQATIWLQRAWANKHVLARCLVPALSMMYPCLLQFPPFVQITFAFAHILGGLLGHYRTASFIAQLVAVMVILPLLPSSLNPLPSVAATSLGIGRAWVSLFIFQSMHQYINFFLGNLI